MIGLYIDVFSHHMTVIFFSESYWNFALRQKCSSVWIWRSWQRNCICAQIIRVHFICVRSRSNLCTSGNGMNANESIWVWRKKAKANLDWPKKKGIFNSRGTHILAFSRKTTNVVLFDLQIRSCCSQIVFQRNLNSKPREPSNIMQF